MNELNVLIGGLATLGIALVPLKMYLTGQQQKHERDHLERMKALEMGRALPAHSIPPAQAFALRVALWIGAGVPSGAFLSSALTTALVGYHEAMWIATGMVGLGGVICGTILASNTFDPATTASDQTAGSFTGGKALVEDDAYDVVSARG
jgi:hypothetical protein